MKTYETMNPGENLGWCRPYVSKDKSKAIIINEENVEVIIFEKTGHIRPDEKELKEFAQLVNPDYDFLSDRGMSDIEIILDVMVEVGCADCPCRDDCDAM